MYFSQIIVIINEEKLSMKMHNMYFSQLIVIINEEKLSMKM